MNGAAMVAGMEVMHGLNNMGLHSESAPNMWCYFSQSQELGVKMGLAPLIITLMTTSKIFASCSYNLTLCWPRSLSSKGGLLPPPGDTMIPLNWMLRLPPGRLELLMPLN